MSVYAGTCNKVLEQWYTEFLLALKQTFPKNYDEVEGCAQQQGVTNDHFCPHQ